MAQRWHYVTIHCPYGSESSTTKMCRNGVTQCVVNSDRELALSQAQDRMSQHINACHDLNWMEAGQLARGLQAEYWAEEPATPAGADHRRGSRSPRRGENSVVGIRLDRMTRSALMDLRRAIEVELSQRPGPRG